MLVVHILVLLAFESTSPLHFFIRCQDIFDLNRVNQLTSHAVDVRRLCTMMRGVLAGNQTKQNQNRISKIPFGRIRKKCCFRFLFDCLFFRSIVGLSGLRHAYPFLQSLFHCVGSNDIWRTSADACRGGHGSCEVTHRSYIRFRSQKTDSIHIPEPAASDAALRVQKLATKTGTRGYATGFLLSYWIPSSSSKLLFVRCKRNETRRSTIAPSNVRPILF